VRPAGERVAVRGGRGVEISGSAIGHGGIEVQSRETRGADAVRALLVGGRVGLLELVTGRAHGGVIADAEARLVAGLLALARQRQQRMRILCVFSRVRGRLRARQRDEQDEQAVQRGSQARDVRPLSPPRSVRQPLNPCDRSSSAAAALRRPVAHTSR
jgi:hypothetical protein